MADVGREVIPTAQLGRGKASVRHWRKVRGSPLITRATSVAGIVPHTGRDHHRITLPRTWESSVTHRPRGGVGVLIQTARDTERVIPLEVGRRGPRDFHVVPAL